MNILPLSALIAVGLAPSAAAAAPAQDAIARVYDANSRVLAEAWFHSATDSFALTKRTDHGSRVYLEYEYIRKNGTVQEATHWGSGTVGETVRFDHNFGEGRRVTFRVCVHVENSFDPCSGNDRENWTIGHA
ncbi:hypothetical protein OHA21_01955 [Actinoplanes sp. NBC_00393]|uniref:hypothetical protein n=1 Tax=Actinoplanes sp. NBC_00393 TaxID=2975953 RepID=UPI002E1AF91F